MAKKRNGIVNTPVCDIVRLLVRKPLADAVGLLDGSQPVTRNFVSCNPSNQAYIGIDTPRTASGDYSASALVYKPAGQQIPVWNNSTGFASRLLVRADGRVSWRPGNATNTDLALPAGSVPDNRLSLIEVSRTGSTGTISVNGTQLVSGPVPTDAANVGQVFREVSVFGSGSVANLNFISGWNQNELFEINGSDAGLTYNNFQSDDIRSFTQNADSDWLSSSPEIQNTFSAGAIFQNVPGFVSGRSYRAIFNLDLDVSVTLFDATGNPAAPSGSSSIDFTAAQSTIGFNSLGAFSAGFDMEIFELLEVA